MNKCASSAVDFRSREIAHEFDRYFGVLTCTWYAFIQNGPNRTRREAEPISKIHFSMRRTSIEHACIVLKWCCWIMRINNRWTRKTMGFFVASGRQARRSFPNPNESILVKNKIHKDLRLIRYNKDLEYGEGTCSELFLDNGSCCTKAETSLGNVELYGFEPISFGPLDLLRMQNGWSWESERVGFNPENTNKLWFVATWATMNANQDPNVGQSVMPTPALERCLRGTSEDTDGHKFGQLSGGWCNHGGPDHHKSYFSNISRVKPRDAQSVGLVCVRTWCQEIPGSSYWTAETRLATNIFHRERDCVSQISAMVESI